MGPVDLKGVTVIGMDEFAIQRGHRYATVVIEPARKRVLWVGHERSEANRLCGDRDARRLVKGSRWLLLRNRENVTREADQVRLRKLLAANRALMITYVLSSRTLTLQVSTGVMVGRAADE